MPHNRHWSKIRLPDVPWLPARGTAGHLLIVLIMWCVLGFCSGAGVTFVYIALEVDRAIGWSWPPTFLKPWVRWAVLAGGIIGAVIATHRGWKNYPSKMH